MLKINNLTVKVNDKIILNDFSLDINDGDIVALMGPNGIGKSTICKVLMGDSNYIVESGSIIFNDIDLLKLSVDERARAGIYLLNQNPIEIPGITNAEMLRTALECRTGEKINFFEFNKIITDICKKINMNPSFIHRGINDGMSGGEKKKNELLHLYVLNPKFIILDELDSGLDVDAIKDIGESLKEYLNPEISVLIITHHMSILEYLKPNRVCIMKDGKISNEGDYNLALNVLKTGFRLDDVSE